MKYKATVGRKLAAAGFALLALTLVLSYSSLAVINNLGGHLNTAATRTAPTINRIGDVRSDRAVQEMRAATHQVVASAEESAAAGETLRQHAGNLSSMVDEMTALVGASGVA